MINRVWRAAQAAYFAACEEWFTSPVTQPEVEAEIEAIATDLRQRGGNGSSRAAAEALYAAGAHKKKPAEVVSGGGKGFREEWANAKAWKQTIHSDQKDDERLARIERCIEFAFDNMQTIQNNMYTFIESLSKRINALTPKTAPEPTKEAPSNAQR